MLHNHNVHILKKESAIMKPWMKSTFDTDDVSEDDTGSDFDTEFEFPKLLVDIDGKKKFIMNRLDEEKLQARIRETEDMIKRDVNGGIEKVQNRKSHGTVSGFLTFHEKENTKVITKQQRQKHGLAPFMMRIPVPGKAFMVGGGSIGKRPLVESNHDKYARIQRSKEKKNKKDEKKHIENLKKRGEVRSLAQFMFDA